MSSHSPVLVLASCSNSKLPGGEQGYDPSLSLVSQLPRDASSSLTEKRTRVLEQLLKSSATRDGWPLRELRANARLREGPDFGLPEGSALYLPAAVRYDGRFWKELGGPADRLKLVREIPHHLLIISALYGLLAAEEPIQNYNLNLHDDRRIYHIWERKDGLTDLLVTYINSAGIRLAIDLTGDPDYRRLVHWPKLPSSVRVLHAHPERLGPSGLPALGALLQRHIRSAPAEALLRVRSGQMIEAKDELLTLSVSISRPSIPSPPPPAPSGPTMYPQELPLDTEETSQAEAEVFRQLRRQLGPGYTVFHRLAWHRLLRNTRTQDGEADFIVAHPEHGILILEVKGGGVHYDVRSSQWSSTDRHFETHEIPNPCAQARKSRGYVLKALKRALGDSAGWLCVGYAVAFPDMAQDANLRPEMDRKIVLFKSDLDHLTHWYQSAMSHFAGKQSMTPPEVMERAITALEDLFAQDFP